MKKFFAVTLLAGASIFSAASIASAGEHLSPRQMEKLMAHYMPCKDVHVPVINEQIAAATFTCTTRQVAFKGSVKIEQLPEDSSFPSDMVYMRSTRLNFLTSLAGWQGGYGKIKGADGHIYAITAYAKLLKTEG